MRVAVDATPLLGPPTGVAQSVRGLLAGLRNGAPDVEVVPYVLSGRAARRGPVPVDGVTAIAIPLPAGAAIRAWGRLDRPRADRWLGGVDVVHGSNFVVPPVRGRPGTATIHDCWCARHPDRCTPAVAALSAAVRRSIARGAWLHVTTDHGAAEVADVYGAVERVVVVPFGVPTSGAQEPGAGSTDGAPVAPVPGGKAAARGGGARAGTATRASQAREALAGRRYVLAIGAADPRKGLPGLVRAYGALAADDPEVLLVLAGPDGSAGADVDTCVAGLPPPVRARVLRLGTVDDATRRELLDAAAVLAYPSLDEGFGFPVLEAMAAGVPVVASDAGALPEVTGGAATLVPVGDDDALGAALEAVLSDDARRAALVAAGLARAATFTWERTARGMSDLWARAAAGLA